MNNMKLTPYFPIEIKPTVPGVYLTKRGPRAAEYWRAFDGKDWHYGIVSACAPSRAFDGKDWHYGIVSACAPSYQDALRKEKIFGGFVNFEWCGLAEKPYAVLNLTREEMDRIHNP